MGNEERGRESERVRFRFRVRVRRGFRFRARVRFRFRAQERERERERARESKIDREGRKKMWFSTYPSMNGFVNNAVCVSSNLPQNLVLFQSHRCIAPLTRKFCGVAILGTRMLSLLRRRIT